MYCSNCGTQRNQNDLYCSKCGEQFLDFNNSNQSLKTDSKDEQQLIILILGIFSIVFFTKPLLSIPLAITIIILQKRQKDKKKLGFVLGIISLLLSLMYIVFIVCFVIFTTKLGISNNSDSIELPKYNFEIPIESFNISGYRWIADDKSVLNLNKNSSYIWYEKENVQNDNYYQGTYEFYTGQEAIDYLSGSLKDFGISREEQEALFENNKYELKNYYLIILVCEKRKVAGVETKGLNDIAYYYGFFDETNKRLDLVNIRTKSLAGFTIGKKISSIDI